MKHSKKLSHQRFVALMLGVLTTTGMARAAAPTNEAETAVSSKEDDEIRQLYRASYSASSAGNLEEARRMLLRAWAIRKTYDVAISLGQLELALNQARDAAEHLDFALRNFPPQQSADMLRQVRSDFARAESQVGTLSVNVSHPGARVLVDGTLVGTAPLLAPIFLTVGSHTISADLDGSQAEKTVVAKASITTSLSLELLRPQSPPAETAYPQQSAAPSRVPVFVGGAVVVVGVGLGVGFALAAGSKTRQSDSLRESIEPGTCYV